MDKRLFSHIHKRFPKFNDHVCEGIACLHMQEVERYIDRVMRCAADGFPPGLKYLGYTRCTPQEAFAIAPARRKNKAYLEMARSDVFLVKYMFSFNGEELRPCYLYLPFVRPGGLITLRGSTFAISPVIADRAISVGVDSIYIPLNRDKLTFRRTVHHYVDNGKRESAYVVWSNIHHAMKKRRGKANAAYKLNMNASPMHYLLCKHGLTETFKIYAGVDIVVGGEEINKKTYPPDEWKIITSTRIKPRTLKIPYYEPSGLRIAVPADKMDNTLSSMLAGVFYIVDHFPDRCLPEYVDDVNLWKILLGYITFSNDASEGRLINDINSHLDSLDGYIDGMVREWLLEDGIDCTDIYQLFMYVISTMSVKVSQSANAVSTMYGKRLTVLRYVLSDVITAIFKFMFALRSNSDKPVTKNEIINAMNRFLKPRLVVRMNRGHGEVTSESSPGDNKIFKITSVIVPQGDTGSGKRSRQSGNVDPSKFLNASIAEAGSYNHLPKSSPTGMSRINPYVRLAGDGTIERDPEKVELIDRVQREIQR